MSRLPLLTAIALLLPQLLWAAEGAALAELSQRSRISEPELALIVQDCELNQRHMNICAFHRAIEAELALDEVIRAGAHLSDRAYAVFKAETQAACLEQAQQDAGGGSMMALMVSSCVEAAYRYRHDALLSLGGIDPAPQPPHKWD